jgi:hypothetical protein
MGEINTFPITTRKSPELPLSTALDAVTHLIGYEGASNVRISSAQVGQGLTKYGTSGGKCIESGIVDAYIFEPLAGRERIDALENGMRFYGTTPNDNIGSVTLNVHNTGVKVVVDTNGAALIGGEVVGIFEVEYDLANTRYILLSKVDINVPTIQTITASGSYAKPVGLKRIKVTVVGGGGGGAGSSALETGSGGGGGGTTIKFIMAGSLSASETITIGGGGSGGSASGNGTGGSTSSFGAHCSATGGGGGTFNATVTIGGNGGSGSGGDINIEGSGGGSSSISTTVYANGGSSMLGGGGRATTAGGNYGGGGGAGSTGVGSAGATGVIIIEEII